MRTRSLIALVIAIIIGTVVFCEFLMYYVWIASFCRWPVKPSKESETTKCLKSMILADTHLLGNKRGHPFDKLRREWQMHRSFSTSVTIFDPSLIAILGDVLDEGLIASPEEFEDYVKRFHYVFPFTRDDDHRMVVVVGNHDIGFHDRVFVYPFLRERFEKRFNVSLVEDITFKGVTFVSVNSMAMDMDRCSLCEAAQEEIQKLGQRLKKQKIRPILLTHFPLFRVDDRHCNDSDSAPNEEKTKLFREGTDCLIRESTDFLIHHLNPSLVLNGHTHHSCTTYWPTFKEYTVASFNWRNRPDPSFLLLVLCVDGHGHLVSHSVSKCFLPREWFIIALYTVSVTFCLLILVSHISQWIRSKRLCHMACKKE